MLINAGLNGMTDFYKLNPKTSRRSCARSTDLSKDERWAEELEEMHWLKDSQKMTRAETEDMTIINRREKLYVVEMLVKLEIGGCSHGVLYKVFMPEKSCKNSPGTVSN